MAAIAGLVAAGVGAAGSFLGSQEQASGQRDAANTAAAAAQQGFNYLTNSPIATSYLPAGATANNSIAALLGMPTGVPTAAGAAAAPTGEPPGVTAAKAAGSSNHKGPGNTPIQDIGQALALGRTITDAQWQQAGYGPGGSGGSGAAAAPAAATPVSAPSAQTAFDNYLNSTGYQFRLSQGNRALTTGAASKGLLGSGATAKAITDYGQNTASAEFNNYLTQLTGLSQRGLSAGATIGSAASGAGNTAANAIQQGYGAAANADAKGIAGLGGGLNSVANYLLTPRKTGSGNQTDDAGNPIW